MNQSQLKGLLIISGAALAIGSSSAIVELIFSNSIDSLLPDSRGIEKFIRPGTITILSTKGEVIQKLGPATREKLNEDDMPSLLGQTFIAAEDRRFYTHKGVDLWGISRAILTNLRQGFVKEGGSTITQQLARTVFLSQDRTITRKLKEAALAYKLERQLTKKQILVQYLNNVYLGSGAYGVADAAWVYFSKTPNELNLAETALLAGLPPAPSIYSPLVNPDIAKKRRSVVLEKMRQQGLITAKELSAARNSPLKLKPGFPKYFSSSAPFFTSWVEKKLPQFLTKEQLELGGLTIKTSLNLRWQKAAQRVIRSYSPNDTEGAIVSISPNTGLVRAMVGGKNFRETQFNRVTQALRSPGSTFKLFPYAAAIGAGFKPEDSFMDTPRCWYGYCPKNFGNRYMGKVSLADALKNSLNTIAVQLLDKVGFVEVISVANKLGIGTKRPLGKYYPLAIGAYEQTVLDMTAAYAAIANQGIYIKPTPFEEIRGPGNILLWSYEMNGFKGQRAIKEGVADTMNWMLQRVVKDGTGRRAALEGRQVAGKTGTSERARDLWFIGSIPQLTTGIWFGYDDNRPTKRDSGEAAFAWQKFMLKIEKDFAVKEFPERNSNQSLPPQKVQTEIHPPWVPLSLKNKNDWGLINSIQLLQHKNRPLVDYRLAKFASQTLT